MRERGQNKDLNVKGYSLIEMLIVTTLILILATIPISLLRRSREKTYEAEALRALRMMALAYENYFAVNGHEYPNYVSNGQLSENIEFTEAEEIWDELIYQQLVPMRYSGFPHDRQDLLARGYVFSIFPADHGAATGEGARHTYALAMMPYEGSIAQRGLVMVQGHKFFTNYPSALPRNMLGPGLYSLRVYAMAE